MAYVWRNYGVDPEDPQLYHVRLDSTVLDLDTCVELIVAAARGRARQAAARLPGGVVVEGGVVQPAPSGPRRGKP
jgi:hypothetical protein